MIACMAEGEDTSPSLPTGKLLLIISCSFLLLLLFIYGKSLNNEFVRWDDGLLIYENPIVREISPVTLKAAFTTYDPELYIPLTLVSYQMDYAIGGTHPFIYHFGNLILHTLNALLVTLFLYLLSRRFWVALFCGILFAVHPLHTEAVAWASARKDVLSSFFFLFSLVTYVIYAQRSSRRSYRLSLASFLLGLLAKVSIITLPLVLLLIDFLNERKFTKNTLKEKIPFFLLSIIFGIIALYGKWGIANELSLVPLALLATKSTVFYLQKLLLPLNLSVLYPFTGEITISSAAFFVPLLILLSLLLCIFWLRKSVYIREILFGVLFFLITLAPSFLNAAKDGDIYFASDRYAYIPSIGFLFLLILLALHWLPRLWAFVSISVVALIFSGMAFAQSAVWADSGALFANVIENYPNSHRAHNNLGNVYRREGDLPLAVTELEAALAIRALPRTHSNLGAVYRRQGKIREALAEYRAGIELDSEDPEPHFGLGIVYASQGDLSQALASYQRATDLDPFYAEAYTNIGALYAAQGKYADAVTQYQLSISSDPFFVQAYYNLAIAFSKLGQRENAIAAYESAIKLRPDFLAARINLGILYYETGRAAESRDQFLVIL